MQHPHVLYGLHESPAAVPAHHNETPCWADYRFNLAPGSRAAAVAAACFAVRPSEAFRVGFFNTAGIRPQRHRHCCRSPGHTSIGYQRRGTASTVAASMCGTAGKSRPGFCDPRHVCRRASCGLESTYRTNDEYHPHSSQQQFVCSP